MVRFGLSTDFLEIEQLDDTRVNEQVMASGDAGQPETEGLCQTANVIETLAGEASNFLSIFRAFTKPHPDPVLRGNGRRRTPHQPPDHFVDGDAFALGREVQNQPVP